MANPFIGQIQLFPYNYAPRGWMFCQGQVLSIASFSSLAALLGTNFGGDGRTTFALPDLRGRTVLGAVPLGFGANYLGAMGGSEYAQLDATSFGHNHTLNCTTNRATTNISTGNQFATAQTGSPQQPDVGNIYNPDLNNPDVQLGSDAVVPSNGGGNGPHNNMQPYLTMNYCIAVQGIYPPR